MVVETVAYCAVPIFFMISGATLIPYREKIQYKSFYEETNSENGDTVCYLDFYQPWI